jgi:hypothetical protein
LDRPYYYREKGLPTQPPARLSDPSIAIEVVMKAKNLLTIGYIGLLGP